MKTALLALALLCAPAIADEWHGKDKQLHLVGGAAIAAAVTAGTRNEWHGFLAGTASGLLKEVYDSTGRGHVSAKDAAVTAIGALIGARFTGWVLSGNRLTYTRRINIF